MYPTPSWHKGLSHTDTWPQERGKEGKGKNREREEQGEGDKEGGRGKEVICPRLQNPRPRTSTPSSFDLYIDKSIFRPLVAIELVLLQRHDEYIATLWLLHHVLHFNQYRHKLSSCNSLHNRHQRKIQISIGLEDLPLINHTEVKSVKPVTYCLLRLKS